jgi:hypothetical protein
MRRGLRIAVILLVVAWTACASVRVSVDYDPNEDFSTYRTFTWFPRPRPATGDYRVDNPLLDQRVRAAVEQTLTARGYRKLEDRAPDFYVNYHLQIDEKIDVRTVNRGYVDRWGYYVGWPETQVTQYDEGSLVIDIADARDKQLAWRGIGVGRVRSRPTPEETTRDVQEVVAQILAKFPPEPK